MAAPTSCLMGRFPIDSTNGSITVNGTPVVIPAGNYFHDTQDSNGLSLADALETAIVGVAGGAYTVTFNLETGIATFANATGGAAAVVVPAALAPFLGLSGTSFSPGNGANVSTSRRCRGLWIPGQVASARRVRDGASPLKRGMPQVDAVTTVGGDGRALTSRAATIQYRDQLEWMLLDEQYVIENSSTPGGLSFEQFWLDIYSYGYPIRYLPLGSAPSSYVTYYPLECAELGKLIRMSNRNQTGNVLWDISLEVSAEASG